MQHGTMGAGRGPRIQCRVNQTTEQHFVWGIRERFSERILLCGLIRSEPAIVARHTLSCPSSKEILMSRSAKVFMQCAVALALAAIVDGVLGPQSLYAQAVSAQALADARTACASDVQKLCAGVRQAEDESSPASNSTRQKSRTAASRPLPEPWECHRAHLLPQP